MFGQDLEWWNTAMLIAQAVTGLAAVAIFIITMITDELKKQAAIDSNEAFNKYKIDAAKDIAEANERAADANQKAKEADLARLQLEAKLAPRQLDSLQQKSIADKMSNWSKLPGGQKQRVAVFPYPPSFEGGHLANQILSVLSDAGWDTNTYPVTYGFNFTGIFGIGVLTSSNPRGIAVAKSLVEALRSVGLDANVIDIKRKGCEELGIKQDTIESEPSCSAISVFVGNHP